MARWGKAELGKAGVAGLGGVCFGTVWLGRAGKAWRGKARFGMAGSVMLRQVWLG